MMLIAGACFAPHPYARIKKIDVKRRRRHSWCRCRDRAKDYRGGTPSSCVRTKPVIADVKTRHEGDPVAILAAEERRGGPEGRRVSVGPANTSPVRRRSARGHGGWCDLAKSIPCGGAGNLLDTSWHSTGDVEAFAGSNHRHRKRLQRRR